MKVPHGQMVSQISGILAVYLAMRYTEIKNGGTVMVKHVIVWTLKDEYSSEEKKVIKAGVKAGLEGLQGKIPGLVEIHVLTEGLASSSGDLMLDSTFEDEASLKGYSVHPAHVEVANGKVRPFTKVRSSFDYEI